ncbi:flavin-dependent dehydrogenase [Actinocorallia herbida]|uniref:Flavin-dependent dehydrogenase n=1 Tax=Actinocorallia herbida TaxID=58109 RepID=A0A3N1CWJ2_9ACTN|nr:FAD-dependent monooxygenase [Actinocorallia herbida]ROO85669.1 flavin-dependent dehydrogenase [Actinocorallia herbida]
MAGNVSGRCGEHAVVIGGSIAGLLAARVLSDGFAKVTVLDRDGFSGRDVPRKGVPQGHHTHGLLAKGREILEEFFPGFTDGLVKDGAVLCDAQNDCVWYNDGLRMRPAPSDLQALAVGRPMLENRLRVRVAALPNVEIRARHEVTGLLLGARGVGGVRVVPVGGGAEAEIEADLVVNASGRGNRGAVWLRELGYEPPAEERVDSGLVYVTREFRGHPGDAEVTAILCAHSTASPLGGFAIRAEGDRWLITVLGMGADIPSTDPAEFTGFAARLPVPEIHRLASRLEPLGPPRLMRIPTSVRRRYERMRAFPDGYAVIGDALCQFNPSYGQGMTIAACEAVALRDALRGGTAGLARRFFPAAAKVIDVPWDMAVGADLRFPHIEGARTPKVKLLNAYVARIHVAAQVDPVVGNAFLQVSNLVKPPQSLFAPRILARVLRRRPGRTTPPVLPDAVPAEALLAHTAEAG